MRSGLRPSPQGGGEQTEHAARLSRTARVVTPPRCRGALAFALLTAGLLSACSDIYYDRRETIALGADDHIASNMVVQMIDPWPRYVGNKNLAFDGQRMQAAADRYRRDCVVPPYPVGTTVLGVQQQTQQASATGCISSNNGAQSQSPSWGYSSSSSTTQPSQSASPSATASSK